MTLSKTYTEEELYGDDFDQSEDDMQFNICEKKFPMRHNTNVDKKTNKKENIRILKKLSKPFGG